MIKLGSNENHLISSFRNKVYNGRLPECISALQSYNIVGNIEWIKSLYVTDENNLALMQESKTRLKILYLMVRDRVYTNYSTRTASKNREVSLLFGLS